ncbi:MAG: hypothetical protein ACSHYB_17940 [Roseibacillus sp.]
MLELFELYSGAGWERKEDLGAGESRTVEGLAVSPAMAAMCVEDYARTVVFLRGVNEAVLQAMANCKQRPVRVLYAGCGPFGTLAVPLMAVFSPEECEFVFLEIHAKALEGAQQLVAELGFEDSVAEFLLGDALNYGVSRSWVPDVVVSETMQACLDAESQVAIFRHLYRQVPEALFVPAEVRVELKLVNPGREFSFDGKEGGLERVEVGTVFALNCETLAGWGNEEVEVLAGLKVRLPDEGVGTLEPLLFTRITTFGEHILADYDSGLTCPKTLKLVGELTAGAELQFEYLLGESPTLRCRGDGGY